MTDEIASSNCFSIIGEFYGGGMMMTSEAPAYPPEITGLISI